MRYLQDYINEAQTRAFETHGAFFAFSNKQLDEQAVEGVKYVSLGAGLICPIENAQKLRDSLDGIYAQGIQQDIAENGKEAIIQRELGNHEAQITGDITDTIDALEGYDITELEVIEGYKIFYKLCVKNDWF